MATSVQSPVTPNNKGPYLSPVLNRRSHATAGAADDDDEEPASENDDDDLPNGPAPRRSRSNRSPTPLTTENLDLFNSASNGAGLDSTSGMFDVGGGDAEDFDLNDDDDDYGEIDNVSDSSDHSDAFEKAVEQDILNDGEAGIDWDDEATFRYDDSWEANQYSLSIDLGEPQTPLERELYQRRPPPVATEAASNHLSTFLKGTPLDEDWSSSSSDSSADNEDQGAETGDGRRASHGSADMADDESQAGAGADEDASESSSSSSSGEETDEDLPQRETVSTPAVALSNTANSLRRPVVRTPASVRSSIETPDRRRPGRFATMRKFVINPNKAVAFSSPDPSSPGGRTIHFNAPKNRNLNWISRHTSRSSSVSTPRTPMNEEHARSLTETINGRLFQRFNCNPEAIAAMSSQQRHEFSHGLIAHRRPLGWNSSTSSLPGGVLADLQDADIDDSAHEEFFDFEAVSAIADDDDSSNNPSQLTGTPMPPPPRPFDTSAAQIQSPTDPATPTPSGSRAAPPSSPLSHFVRPAKPELGAAFEPAAKAEPPSPDSDVFGATATASSSPRKRRTSHDEDPTTLTPVMKRQRF